MQLTLCAVLFGAAFAAMSPSPRPSSSPSYSAVAPLATDIGGINLSVKENACKLDATVSTISKIKIKVFQISRSILHEMLMDKERKSLCCN